MRTFQLRSNPRAPVLQLSFSARILDGCFCFLARRKQIRKTMTHLINQRMTHFFGLTTTSDSLPQNGWSYSDEMRHILFNSLTPFSFGFSFFGIVFRGFFSCISAAFTTVTMQNGEKSLWSRAYLNILMEIITMRR